MLEQRRVANRRTAMDQVPPSESRRLPLTQYSHNRVERGW